MSDRFFLYDDTTQAKTRFVSYMGEEQRHDLALIYSDRHYGKVIVLDMLSNRFAIIGQDDLKEEGYLEFAFGISEEKAADLLDFLNEIIY
ncbi:DUF3055 domain-containing protein [Bacillus sp. AFS017336]|uniref:DUF3055 domain-containing protein n=1 Tax=Bacillus sp. AFS017336 TaxID=2033489 RepID=UPI000BF00C34|nr:DUF3055 domain-containing protein [Bacillus sp. AFS017336]PEL12035.1 cytoplasmic protein [Bacillus sp. AFS017336]